MKFTEVYSLTGQAVTSTAAVRLDVTKHSYIFECLVFLTGLVECFV